MIDTAVLGCGAVGTALARAMLRSGWPLRRVWTRSAERARTASLRLGIPVAAGPPPADLEDVQLILLCVRDEAIVPLSRVLTTRGRMRTGAVVAHTSGCLTAASLTPASGRWRGSIHPLTVFGDPPETDLTGCAFAIEGDAAALPALERLARALGGQPLPLTAAEKPRYHAAAVMASSLVLALLDQAAEMGAAAGLTDAPRHLAHLTDAALAGARRSSLSTGLTGPLVRGDVATVAAHLEALSPDAGRIYRALSRRALGMLPAAGLEPEVRARLVALLDVDGSAGD